MRLKAVIFDLDGTLVDTEKYNFYAWQKLLQKYGYNVGLETYAKNYVGQSKEYIAKKCEELVHVGYVEIMKEKDIYFYEFLANEPITEISGAKELLESLKRKGVILACATSGDRKETKLKLETLGFTEYFQSIITGDDVVNPKPDPEIYLKSLANLGIRAEDAIAVEDTLTGYKSATSAGIMTFMVKTYINRYLTFPTEDVVESLMDVVEVVE